MVYILVVFAYDWVRKSLSSLTLTSELRLELSVAIIFLFQESCYVCQHFISPDEKVSCSVRNCYGAYHLTCAKTIFRLSDPKKFSCPQHVSG